MHWRGTRFLMVSLSFACENFVARNAIANAISVFQMKRSTADMTMNEAVNRSQDDD